MALFTLNRVRFKGILDYPDHEIAAGVTTFIRGESGTGKSTLLRLLNGTLSATEGRISYHGKDIETCDPIELRREALLVGQAVYLFDTSIRENFNEYRAYRDLGAISDAEIKHYLDICAANLPLDSMCNFLSGGERQRVFLAINLSMEPKVLLLDEPTSALDDKTAATLITNIRAYCKENAITLIIVSHDQALADKYADELIILMGGAMR